MQYLRDWVVAAVLSAMVVCCGCAGPARVVPSPKTAAPAALAASTQPASVQPDWAAKGHPWLMMDAKQIQSWDANLSPGQRKMWQQVTRGIDRLKKAHAPADRRFDRGHGNMMAQLAVTAKLSGDAELAAVAKQYLLDVTRATVWDANTDLLHGHMLWGAAIAYDWLWQDLSPQERTAVRSKLAHEAQLQFEASTIKRGYWRNQYLQNHGHVNFCGLAFAAAALYGEDPRAGQWLRLADEFFAETFRWSNPDGTSIEGLSYGVYALEFCLRYAELAGQVHGVDYSHCPWFANMPLFVLYSTLPVLQRNEWAMDFADSPRSGNSHLPVHSMAQDRGNVAGPGRPGRRRDAPRPAGRPRPRPLADGDVVRRQGAGYGPGRDADIPRVLRYGPGDDADGLVGGCDAGGPALRAVAGTARVG